MKLRDISAAHYPRMPEGWQHLAARLPAHADPRSKAWKLSDQPRSPTGHPLVIEYKLVSGGEALAAVPHRAPEPGQFRFLGAWRAATGSELASAPVPEEDCRRGLRPWHSADLEIGFVLWPIHVVSYI
ncbi:hypothetical protein [Thauera butanivorans]|jgi:hypothetical protein|uniref:hypothetical protein n=1 Tax=Thauera butanivorans TaxID=86174 RepID=UPI0012FCCD9C|nr:hypothetical protein [Thauera butanivorans]